MVMSNTDKKREETILGVERKSKLLFSYGLRIHVCITQVQQITKDKKRGQQQQQSLPRYPFLFTVTFSELLVYINQRNQTNKEKDRVETKEHGGTRVLWKHNVSACVRYESAAQSYRVSWVASQIVLYHSNNCTKMAAGLHMQF